jgi:hypothetical protein
MYPKANIAVGKNKKQGVHRYPNLSTAFYKHRTYAKEKFDYLTSKQLRSNYG